ncbi:hypothetical protein FOZ60_012579 [Perkinsus olseni]|uniref:ceramidase n=1 Tax=Perkinsus olseni TaxID=32597 RepID=A0A7J6NB63_PEROL|nr:hypothetical protein FOZ60_012579 [Perkinsus olseni]
MTFTKKSTSTLIASSLLFLLGSAPRGVMSVVPADVGDGQLPPQPPTVTIDMSLAPEEHFKPAVRAVLKEHAYEDSFEPLFREFNASVFGKEKLQDKDYETLADAADKFYPMQARELRGISEEFAAQGHYVSYPYLSAWMYAIEMEHIEYPSSATTVEDNNECTALLVADSEGNVVQGRNMDRPPVYTPYARPVTLNFDVINNSNGVPDFKASGFYWIAASFVTIDIPGHLSMQANYRYYPTYRDTPTKEDIFEYIEEGRAPALQTYDDMIFEHGIIDIEPAVEFLSKCPMSIPAYLSMAGAGDKFQAAVVSRDEDGLAVDQNGVKHEPLYLNNQSGDYSEANNWYLVQTNYDHWEADPIADPRRTVAENCVKEHGKTNDLKSTWDVVMDCSFLNGVSTNHTIYTSIMDPTYGDFSTYIRYDADDAWNNNHPELDKAEMALMI